MSTGEWIGLREVAKPATSPNFDAEVKLNVCRILIDCLGVLNQDRFVDEPIRQ